MPLYLFQNRKTGEIKEFFFHMDEEKVVRGYDRVFTSPNAAIDTEFNEMSADDFAEKTRNKKGTLGDLQDKSKELSEKRKKVMGHDPVEKQYFKKYSEIRKGKKHPNDPSLHS